MENREVGRRLTAAAHLPIVVARYRITFDVTAVDVDDARHWAFYIASDSHGMKDVDVVSVYRLGPSLAPELQKQKSSDEKASGRHRHGKDDGVRWHVSS